VGSAQLDREKKIATEGEKWIVCNNTRRKGSRRYPSEPPKPIPKPDFHPKVLLSIWWDWQDTLYFEPLPPS